jgi:hypothetical protein
MQTKVNWLAYKLLLYLIEFPFEPTGSAHLEVIQFVRKLLHLFWQIVLKICSLYE